MLDSWPRVLREPLWHLKHRLVHGLADRRLVESLQVTLWRQLRSLSISAVLDVGANEGSSIRTLRRLGYTGRIWAFEPLSRHHRRLLALADDDSELKILPYALGDENKTMSLRVSRDDVFSSFLPPNEFGTTTFPSMACENMEEVDVKRADAVLPSLLTGREHQMLHVKLDTQGFDLKVLSGFGTLLDKVRSLQVEISILPIYDGQASYLETLRELAALDFVPTCFYPVIRDADLRLIEMDVLLRRR